MEKRTFLKWTCTLLFGVLFVIYFSENIAGEHRFRSFCNNEAGVKIYKHARRDEIWLADSRSSARVIASFVGVSFARYFDSTTGKLMDVHYKGGPRDAWESYGEKPEDENLQPSYGIRSMGGKEVQGELRLTKYGYELYALADLSIIAGFYEFGFFFFDPSKVPLSSPAARSCPRSLESYKDLQKAINK